MSNRIKYGPGGLGRSPYTIFHAARDNKPKIVRKFIEENFNLEARDPDGRTALHIAASFGSIDVVRMLIKAKADTEAEDPEGNTPHDLAKFYQKWEVVNYLKPNTAPSVHLLIGRYPPPWSLDG